MDAFYAAIEQLDDSALAGRPILVGPRSERGVVLTASYEARPYGVGSAMPMAKARRLCPSAVIVPPRFDRYQEVSRTIMKVFADFTPDVETLSLDEAFLDMSGSERLLGNPETVGRRLKQAVREATSGLTASVGISATKYVAKVASAYQKPDGLTVVSPKDARAWLAPQSVSRLWGVGPKTEARLRRLGLDTIGSVAETNPKWLAAKLGKAGLQFHALSLAEDPRAVIGRRAPKSIGSECTLEKNVWEREDIKCHLHGSADRIGRRLRQKGYLASGVGVKLKTADFAIITRQRRLHEPTDVADRLYAGGVDLLDEFAHPGPFRLIGLVAYDLVAADTHVQLALFGTVARRRRLEVAVDALIERFGPDIVHPADHEVERTRIASTLDFLDED